MSTIKTIHKQLNHVLYMRIVFCMHAYMQVQLQSIDVDIGSMKICFILILPEPMSLGDWCYTANGIILISNPYNQNDIECGCCVVEKLRHNCFHSWNEINENANMNVYEIKKKNLLKTRVEQSEWGKERIIRHFPSNQKQFTTNEFIIIISNHRFSWLHKVIFFELLEPIKLPVDVNFCMQKCIRLTIEYAFLRFRIFSQTRTHKHISIISMEYNCKVT